MNELIVELSAYHIRDGYIHIPSTMKDGFPNKTTEVDIDIKDFGPIESRFYVEKTGSHQGFSKGLRPWFRKESLRNGDRIQIVTTIPTKKYRLEIVK